MEDAGVVDVDVIVVIGGYEAMARREFCPELCGCFGEGIILARK
jgi:hypothetical protein